MPDVGLCTSYIATFQAKRRVGSVLTLVRVEMSCRTITDRYPVIVRSYANVSLCKIVSQARVSWWVKVSGSYGSDYRRVPTFATDVMETAVKSLFSLACA